MSVWIASVAKPQDLGGRAILSYQLFGDSGVDTRSFLQLYEANFQRDVSDALRLRLSFRGQGNARRTQFPLFESKTNYWKLQPSGEIDYLLPRLQIVGTYDLYDTISDINDIGWKQRYQRITESLFWFPDRLPSLNLQAQQLANSEPSSSVDERENLFYQALNYTWRGLTVGQAANYGELELQQSGFTRKTSNLQGLLRFEGGLPEGRLSASVNGVVGWTRLEEISGGQGVSAPTRVVIASALYSHDETPLDGRDVVAGSAPGLTDGDLVRSAGISLGPDGESFQNIVVDTGRFIGLDTFRVWVRDGSGNPVQFGGLVRWDVFVSGEGLDWVPVSGEATTSFLPTLSLYEVSFPKTSSRYFKLVSFGTNSIPTMVTEVQAFFHVAFAAQASRLTDVQFVSASAAVSSRLSPWVTLSYYGIFNDYRVAPGGVEEYATADNDQQFSALLTPTSRLNLTLRYERRRADNGNLSLVLDGAWAIAQYAFNPNLNTTVEASRAKETNLREVTTDTLRFHNYARFLPSLDLSLDMGVSKSDYALEGTSSKQVFLNAVSYSQIATNVRLTLAANLQRTTNEGLVFGPRESENQNYYGEVYYRPGSQLYLSARFGYALVESRSATTKRFRVEWYPFAGGTVGIGTIYDQDVDTSVGFRRFQRLQILPQWAINPNVTLNLNYNVLQFRSEGSASAVREQTARQFFLTLTVTR